MNFHFEIEIISDTFAKRTTAQSADLSLNQKHLLKVGDRLIPAEIEEARCQHIWYKPIKDKEGWFLFREHVKIWQVFDNGSMVGIDGEVRAVAQPLESLPETDLITLDELKAIAIYAPKNQLASLCPHINETMRRYAIATPLRIAHFIAQIAHESDGFNTTEEYASGADYEWRDDLGNIYAGDGVRFKGRGLIQVTGRANYAECGKALGVDLIANPERLHDYDLACLSAGWFWDKMQLNGDADNDDVMTITRLINGGYNGLSDRQEYLSRAKEVLGI